MVVYCTIPKEGGSTNFHNSGVHVKPVTGAAVFFSYMDPKTRITDNRFTEHSGCPVYEGEKKSVTQWIRLGVDKENPWDSFNTCKCCCIIYILSNNDVSRPCLAWECLSHTTYLLLSSIQWESGRRTPKSMNSSTLGPCYYYYYYSFARYVMHPNNKWVTRVSSRLLKTNTLCSM